nr:MAG TPA_asm: hypothetical protein [Bacteriophage sp.]
MFLGHIINQRTKICEPNTFFIEAIYLYLQRKKCRNAQAVLLAL